MNGIIERRYQEEKIGQQEHTQLLTWLLHWILVYSFTNKDLSNNGLFATVLAEYGQNLVGVVKMRAE